MSFYSVTKSKALSPVNIIIRFTLGQHCDLLEIYFQNKGNWWEIARPQTERREGQTVYDIHKFIANVHETGFIDDAPRGECARTVRTSENIKTVA